MNLKDRVDDCERDNISELTAVVQTAGNLLENNADDATCKKFISVGLLSNVAGYLKLSGDSFGVLRKEAMR